MDINEIFALIFSIAAGVFSIAVSIFNWDFFFENRIAAFFVSVIGRKGARIYYTILGLVLLFLAYKIFWKYA